MALAWFSFTGSNPSTPADYTHVGINPPNTCDGTEQICAIQAEPDLSNKPTITPTLLGEMVVALNDQTPSDNVVLKDRPVR